MRSFRSLLSLALCVFVLVSCYKNKPKKGDYKIDFIYSSELTKSYSCEISESKSKWIYLQVRWDNGSASFPDTLIKSKNKVSGYIRFQFGSSIHKYKLEGLIKKDDKFSLYKIDGDLYAVDNLTGSETLTPAGCFEIYK